MTTVFKSDQRPGAPSRWSRLASSSARARSRSCIFPIFPASPSWWTSSITVVVGAGVVLAAGCWHPVRTNAGRSIKEYRFICLIRTGGFLVPGLDLVDYLLSVGDAFGYGLDLGALSCIIDCPG